MDDRDFAAGANGIPKYPHNRQQCNADKQRKEKPQRQYFLHLVVIFGKPVYQRSASEIAPCLFTFNPFVFKQVFDFGG